MGIFGGSSSSSTDTTAPADTTTQSTAPVVISAILPTLNSYQREALYGALELALRREGTDTAKVQQAHYELATLLCDPGAVAPNT